MTITLEFQKRAPADKPEALRKAGKIPAIFYGKKQASTPITLSSADFAKVWKKAGESGVVTLTSKEGEFDALIYEVDRDPVKDTFRHADFYVFEKGQKMKIKTPIEFVGVAPAVKELGGVLVKVVRELEVEAAPKDLPSSIQIDISALIDFKSQILAKSIALPAGVTLITNPEEVLASVYEPKEEVEAAVAPTLDSIEVEKKGKEAKEGEEAAAEAPAKEEKK
jgi:large subunit ribosomal protein L25